MFGVQPQWPFATLDYFVEKLKCALLEIVAAEESSRKLTFTDVGAIVYYLKAVPWLVPGFSVESHVESLLKLQSMLDEGRALTFAAMKYMIEARREHSH